MSCSAFWHETQSDHYRRSRCRSLTHQAPSLPQTLRGPSFSFRKLEVQSRLVRGIRTGPSPLGPRRECACLWAQREGRLRRPSEHPHPACFSSRETPMWAPPGEPRDCMTCVDTQTSRSGTCAPYASLVTSVGNTSCSRH